MATLLFGMLYLDAQRLIYIGGGGGHGTNGTEYRAEFEQFSRIVIRGADNTGLRSPGFHASGEREA